MPILELSESQVVDLVKQLPRDKQREALLTLAEGADQQVHIEDRFRELVHQWKEETRFLSSIHDMVSHPAYLQIIGIGKEVLPLLVEELRRDPDHWFVALQAITGTNPIPPGVQGNVDQMTQAWLLWAERHGL